MIVSSSTPPRGATLGGKATGLYRLRAAGAAVPDFLVLPAETFASALASAGTWDDPRRAALLAWTPSAADRAAVTAVLAGWGFPREAVAVRSSGGDEDGAAHAFAGLHDSVLHVQTESDLWAAAAQCAASVFSARASSYRGQKGLPPAPAPAVVVQRQVAAVASGVLFSTSPEFPQELAIHAVWGYGEGLVGGHFSADEFYFLKNTAAENRRVVAAKPERWGSAGAEAVPPAQQAAPCLTAGQLATLFSLGQQLEKAFGGPQDLEFVTDLAGAVWLVQARPITQPIPEVIVYDNANIQESYYGVTTPLTFSFAQRAYATVYRQTMGVLGLPPAQIAAYEPVVQNLLGLVQGRIYYQINNWYRGLQLLPSFRQNKADMERMMGLTEPVDFVQDQEKTLRQKLALLPRLVPNLARLLWRFARLPTLVKAFHAHFNRHYAAFRSLDLAALSAPDLLAVRADLDHQLLNHWTTPIVNDFRVMMTHGAAVRRLTAAAAPEAEALLSRWLAADPDLASAQPARQLQVLAAQAHADAALLAALRTTASADLPALVAARFPAFARDVAAYLDRYGDRSIGELKLETRTLRTEPALFYDYLRNFLVAPVTASTAAATVSAAAAAEVAALSGRLSSIGRWRLGRALRAAHQAIGAREALRLERTRLFGMYRDLYDALGARLTASGQLPDARAVYSLTEAEIAEAAHGRIPVGSTRALVDARRAEFAAYAAAPAPPGRLVAPSPPTAARALTAPPDRATPALHGTGCFPGVVTGEVIVIAQPGDSLAVAGRIVAAPRTDPGWAALFPACRGVLIERGSALSHSVIVLRELGIPTVINLPGLTAWLRSGDHVCLDGTTGAVTRVAPAPPLPA